MATSGDGNAQQYMRISDINTEPLEMHMPIRGYEEMPVVPLEKAVEPLVSILPEILDYVYIAKQRCKPVPADGLTKDESASIILYSMEWEPHGKCLYFALNSTLRAEDRRKLKPWFSYLKLILTALARIRSSRRTVYRGVKMDLSNQYPPGKTFVWWGFSTCTSNMGALESEQFLGKNGERTMFSIDCESGKDISRHSYYQSEEEILLIAARQFVVNACLEPAPGIHIIQLTETESPVSLIKLDTNNSESSADVQPKSDYTKPAASYKTKESSTKTKETAKSVEKPKKEEFAIPGAYEKLPCEGRHCAKCGKCRDWYYTADNKSWQWIRDFNNWEDDDWKTWRNYRIYERFQKRDGVKCLLLLRDGNLDSGDRDHFGLLYCYDNLGRDLLHGRLGFLYGACLCEDNIQSAF